MVHERQEFMQGDKGQCGLRGSLRRARALRVVGKLHCPGKNRGRALRRGEAANAPLDARCSPARGLKPHEMRPDWLPDATTRKRAHTAHRDASTLTRTTRTASVGEPAPLAS
ncbi:hypothetical protein B0G80_2009 [Paraburkholderia sp. BL6669N2]|uniref:hypothetical protein n=1 Tax=Paraburkholderia sp. BL6669N2 TaxID=1938807 RepID=UPI000E26F9E2|nr:hypothetical protein [Paraburkholderia sp. BL6669N2]REG59274.1 hypothetical protein B0G80_2009 [Paraburkholderia sp. BL6669N2]